MDLRPSGDERGAVARLELVELAVVDDPGENVARVERRPQVGGRDAEELLGIVAGRPPGAPGRRTELGVVEAADDLAPDAEGVELVGGEVVGEPAHPACISAPPRLSSSLSSPVAIFTNGGPPRNTFDRWSIITT